MLSDDQIRDFEARLSALRRELEKLLDATTDGAKPVDLDQPIGRVSRIDAIQQQKLTQANRERVRIRLRHVLTAIAAIRDSEYGYCKRCDEPIGIERLEARPEAPLCLPCAEALEGR